jgi:hypothetical protein
MGELLSRRFFLCTGKVVLYKDLYLHAGAHILGEVRRRYVSGLVNGEKDTRRFSVLSIYDTPWEADRVPPVSPIYIMDVMGDAWNVVCRFQGCANVQRWEVGKDALIGLLMKMGALNDEEVSLKKS